MGLVVDEFTRLERGQSAEVLRHAHKDLDEDAWGVTQDRRSVRSKGLVSPYIFSLGGQKAEELHHTHEDPDADAWGQGRACR